MAQAFPSRMLFVVSHDMASSGACQRLDKLLPAVFPQITRRKWRDLLDANCVKRNGDITRVASKPIVPGDVIELHIGRINTAISASATEADAGKHHKNEENAQSIAQAPPRILSADELSPAELDELVSQALDSSDATASSSTDDIFNKGAPAPVEGTKPLFFSSAYDVP